MFKGAIFDVDGTLLDSMSMWGRVTLKCYNSFGKPLTEEENLRFRFMPLSESLPLIYKELELDSDGIEEFNRRFMSLLENEYKSNLLLKPYAREYLEKLHNSGVRIALATSGYYDFCRLAFERLGVWEYIDAIALSSEVGVPKSEPDVYLLAAERLGVSPDECVAFEDIPHGLVGASAAGMYTVAIRDSSNLDKTHELLELSDRYINDWSELLDDNL